MGDLYSVQRELTQRLAGELRREVSPSTLRSLRDAATANPEAYSLVMRAEFYFDNPTSEGDVAGYELVQQAVELDPEYALAWAAMSHAMDFHSVYGMERPEAKRRGRQAIQKALSLDDGQPMVWLEVGYHRYHFEWDWAGAAETFERALELDPTYDQAHIGLGWVYPLLGRPEEGLVHAQRGVDLQPATPFFRKVLGRAQILTGDIDGAIQSLERALRMGDVFDSLMLLADLSVKLGDVQKVRSYVDQFSDAFPDHPGAPAVRSYFAAATGETARALELLDDVSLADLEKLGRTNSAWVPMWYLASAQAKLGNLDEAFELLERLLEEEAPIIYGKIAHEWDPFRDDARFRALMESAVLPW